MIDHACVQTVHKPWGSTNLSPWSNVDSENVAIGEIWFQRPEDLNQTAPLSSLLLKLLFTSAPLSIQVHPDDVFAQSIGLEHGKNEAWYILSAEPGAQVAVGLKEPLSRTQLRAAIKDGSIADLIQWYPVAPGDAIFVPAGTIHSIGAGLVIAEIQQRSDATFRLFDYGRKRDLHVDNGVDVAHTGIAQCQAVPKRLNDARTMLVTNPYFTLEKIDLLPGSEWQIHVEQETWMFILAGHAKLGILDASVGDTFFLETAHMPFRVGANGLKALMAYVGSSPKLHHISEGAQKFESSRRKIPHLHLSENVTPFVRVRAPRAAS